MPKLLEKEKERVVPKGESLMKSDDESSLGVRIGNVHGGIHGSMIVGRDLSNATITIGGQPIPANQEPTVDELKQLLAEIQKELAEIVAQKDALKEVSSAAPFTTQGAEQSVKDAAEKIQPQMKPEAAKSVQKGLTDATSILSSILDGAKTLAEKAGALASVVKPLADKLEPVVERIG